jgi:adenine-specific DNA glycosylase
MSRGLGAAIQRVMDRARQIEAERKPVPELSPAQGQALAVEEKEVEAQHHKKP